MQNEFEHIRSKLLYKTKGNHSSRESEDENEGGCKMKRVLTLLFVVALLFAMAMPTYAEEEAYKICFIAKSTDDFWKTVQGGTEKAAAEAGLEITQFIPQKETSDFQVTLVEEAVLNGYDAIVLAPIDPEPLAYCCQAAIEAGVVVTLVDTLISTEDYAVAYCTNNLNAGKLAAQNMAERIGEEGKVYIINSNPASTSNQDRENGFKDEIEANYPNIEIVGVQYCNMDAATAANQTMDALTADPEIKGFYVCDANCTVGVANGLLNMQREDVILGGFDSTTEEIALLEEQVIDFLIVQQPAYMGYLGTKAAIDILNGVEVAHEIVDTGCAVATYENRETEEIQQLFYPLEYM